MFLKELEGGGENSSVKKTIVTTPLQKGGGGFTLNCVYRLSNAWKDFKFKLDTVTPYRVNSPKRTQDQQQQ